MKLFYELRLDMDKNLKHLRENGVQTGCPQFQMNFE